MIGQLAIHIGDPKTGTSSIQTVLFDKRWRIEAPRIAYPPQLSCFPLANSLATKGGGPSRRRHMKDLARWASETDADLGVISAEQFSRVDPVVLREALERFLPDLAGEARVIAYVRPHLARFVSAFVQRSKTGAYFEDMETFHLRLRKQKILAYAPRFLAWRDVFGDRFLLRPMQRDQLFRNDAVADFFHSLVRHEDFTIEGSTNTNEAVSLSALAAIRDVQRLFVREGIAPQVRHQMGGMLASRINGVAGKGEKVTMPIALARTVSETYRADAELLDREFFSGTPMTRAIEVAAGDYPETVPPVEIDAHFDAARIDMLRERTMALVQSLRDQPPGVWSRIAAERGQTSYMLRGKARKRRAGKSEAGDVQDLLARMDAVVEVIARKGA